MPRHDELPDFASLPEDSARNLHRLGMGAFVLLLVSLFLAVIYSIGEKLEDFRWSTFLNGLASFCMIILAVCLAIATITGMIRGIAWLLPETVARLTERRRLNSARRAAEAAIERKHQLCEERARLTAQLKATFLFERETTRAANARASQEFRDALQNSVMRSCQIAYDQISQLVEQYEQVLTEIESSELPAAEKTELLNSLTAQLDVAASEERNRDAQKMMEAEIWKVRFRKARLMAQEKSDAAVDYLTKIRSEARSSRMKDRIDAIIEQLRAEQTPERNSVS